jgi:integrase
VLKPRTVADMRKVMAHGLSGWMSKPITSITADMVRRKHRELGAKSLAQANLAMRYLRAVLALAQMEYRDAEGKPILESNPVTELSRRKAWHRVDRRKTLIKTHQFPAWYAAVLALPVNVQSYILFVLFTGLRAGEAATLRWETVDLTAGTFSVIDTKNRSTHELPLSDYLLDMLKAQRKRVAGEFVFPGLHGKGHIKSAQSAIRKVEAASGVEFCLHDLRRTFATVAESLDIPAYAVKRLLNHAMAGDVTAGYVVTDVERLRRPMQKITDYLLAACGAKAGAEVVQLVAQS